MAMKFTKIPEETFQELQLNAGILLYDFDPENVPSDETLYKNLVCATTGGLSVSVTPTFSDLGEDIDNCPKNTMELKHLDSIEATASGTAVTMDPKFTTFCLAAADVDDKGHVTLRSELDVEKDFKDIWWVGDYNQGKGFVAVKLENALSTDGFTIQTNDQTKATAAFTFTGHYSIENQEKIPIEFYISSDGAKDADTGDDGDGDDGDTGDTGNTGDGNNDGGNTGDDGGDTEPQG